jgi:hypothetical protein
MAAMASAVSGVRVVSDNEGTDPGQHCEHHTRILISDAADPEAGCTTALVRTMQTRT